MIVRLSVVGVRISVGAGLGSVSTRGGVGASVEGDDADRHIIQPARITTIRATRALTAKKIFLTRLTAALSKNLHQTRFTSENNSPEDGSQISQIFTDSRELDTDFQDFQDSRSVPYENLAIA
jgi:hypothetical protein